MTKLGIISILVIAAGCSSTNTGDGAASPAAEGAPGTGNAGAVANAAGAASAGRSASAGNAAPSGNAPAAAGGGAGSAAAGSGGSDEDAGVEPPSDSGTATPTADTWNDPGKMPWQLVPDDKVAEECKLDPALLAAQDSQFGSGWAVVRFGKLCHEAGPRDTPTEAYSATKTLGALVTGIASYETRMFMKSGPRTGQLLDTDMASDWLTSQSYNREARVAHVLGMVGHNSDLSLGNKSYMYDTVGSVQINSLSTMVDTAISQDAARLGSGIEDFTKKFLFDALGMTDSSWTGAVYAYTWSTTLHDMARVGVLMVHKGMWSGQRVLDESWVYKMTHPSFEDANTGYGYLTWLNARTGSTGPGGAFSGTAADTCAPAALWPRYPHPISESPDCNYGGMPCDQEQDVGAWSAQGAGGQFILGHPGLDLVIVAKDFADGGGPGGMWNAVRPALVAHDPTYKGDEAAFCKAYAENRYAPDLPSPWIAPYDAVAPLQP
jgi:hypothetical protein